MPTDLKLPRILLVVAMAGGLGLLEGTASGTTTTTCSISPSGVCIVTSETTANGHIYRELKLRDLPGGGAVVVTVSDVDPHRYAFNPTAMDPSSCDAEIACGGDENDLCTCNANGDENECSTDVNGAFCVAYDAQNEEYIVDECEC